jgi:hypothetical protein
VQEREDLLLQRLRDAATQAVIAAGSGQRQGDQTPAASKQTPLAVAEHGTDAPVATGVSVAEAPLAVYEEYL